MNKFDIFDELEKVINRYITEIDIYIDFINTILNKLHNDENNKDLIEAKQHIEELKKSINLVITKYKEEK